jgi:hypothetical protein
MNFRGEIPARTPAEREAGLIIFRKIAGLFHWPDFFLPNAKVGTPPAALHRVAEVSIDRASQLVAGKPTGRA